MKVYWTKFALSSLADIYRYYKVNVSVDVANKIRNNVISSSKQLVNNSLSGSTEDLLVDLLEGHRYLVRGNYKIIYKISNKKVYITDVFDTRQNPNKIIERNE